MVFLSEYEVIDHGGHNLIFAHLNVRFLVSYFEGVKDCILVQNFDIVGITETWLKYIISSSIASIEGYSLFREDRADRRGGGGRCCALY